MVRSSARAIAALGCLIFLSGCVGYPSWVVWRGYKAPEAASQRSDGNCPVIGVQNLTERQAAAMTEAMTEACAVLRSAEFAAAISGRDWLPGCGVPRISGSEALAAVLEAPDFSVQARKPFLALALTDPANRRVTLGEGRIAGWWANAQLRGGLINTLVHEATHLVPEEGGEGFRFTDRGHGGRDCADDDLVSYGFGNIAERLWLLKQDPEAQGRNAGAR